MMSHGTYYNLAFLLAIGLLAVSAQKYETIENGLKSKEYLSPKVSQYPGTVSNKYYNEIEFPKGHIAIKSFNAEFVDEAGNSVSLKESYLHHWLVIRYYKPIGVEDSKFHIFFGFNNSDFIVSRNSGMCNHDFIQFFGLGSETRKTSSYIPDPYGIEIGNPLEIPSGYEEKWLLNIHAIDTRGVVDPMGCIECRCDLYNVTMDEYGQPFKPGYVGGLWCCYDETQCKLKNGFPYIKKDVYLKYTVKWVDWSDFIVPVKIYIFDVTDMWQKTGVHDCVTEYDVEKSTDESANDFISTRKSILKFPIDGDFIYGFGHLHSGGTGSAIYGEDGRVICSSTPIYGKGNDVGDEAGHIVGTSTCYPKPGSVKLVKGETLTLESNYSNEKSHYGVMGAFYALVADASWNLKEPAQIHDEASKVPFIFWGIPVFGLAISAAALVAYRRRKQNEVKYLTL